MANHFKVIGGLTVQDSSTVLCARYVPGKATVKLTRDVVGKSPVLGKGIFSEDGVMEFKSGWEVLMGQATVINWIRSTSQKLTSMRYAGEYKIPGGNVDAGETLEQAARRELAEELLQPSGIELPDNAVLRPFTTKQTRPIRSRSNLMHCFVALADENSWLANLDLDSINAGLRRRHDMFRDVMTNDANSFWDLPTAEKELLSPETNEVRWVPLHEAVQHCLSSMVSPILYVNDYQKKMFQKLGKKQRDPMFITGAMLMELEGFPSVSSLLRHCKSANLEKLTAEEQWLFPGMTDEDVDVVFRKRAQNSKTGVNPSFKGQQLIAELRQQRLALDLNSRL